VFHVKGNFYGQLFITRSFPCMFSSTVVAVWLLSRFQEGGKTVVSSFRPWKRYASGLMEIVIQQHQIANTPARTQQ